jgi:hypothetical protein
MKASVILVLVVARLTVAKSVGTTMRSTGQVDEQPPSNTLAFLAEGLSIKCIERAHGITQGQTYVGVVCGADVLAVIAGRENSADMAYDFEKGIEMFTTIDDCSGEQTGVGFPQELNFYVEVDITFMMGSKDMGTHTLRFGQGHYGGWIGGNNWWVGGTNCHYTNCGITCHNNDGQKVQLYSGEKNRENNVVHVGFFL